MHANIELMGVRMNNLSRDDINSWLINVLSRLPEQKFIATLNPEILLKAEKDARYREILNKADLALCDGFGIKLLSFLKGRQVKVRYTGVELVEFLIGESKKKDMEVLVAVSKKSLSSPEEIEQAIGNEYNLRVQAKYYNGDSFFEKVENMNAQIVFVNFGAPEQEKFIFENKRRFAAAKILVGVGGAFDFLTGKLRRAPRWVQNVGLEWLWRLIQEPKRARRIFDAVIIFPIRAIFSK